MRPSKRQPDEMRAVTLERGVARHAEGSCRVRFGDTEVFCTASLEERVPPWLRGNGKGWVTAEYGMLPRATSERTRREATAGHQSGRTQEIQRLIGRSLRAAVDLGKLGRRSLWVDCDVLAADGGTRTTAITGAYLALQLAVERLIKSGKLEKSPLLAPIAATSVGVFEGKPILDLCYLEDKDAAVDMNVVMNARGRFIEIQAAGEEATFSPKEMNALVALARKGLRDLFAFQKKAWAKRPKK